jgi:sortase A
MRPLRWKSIEAWAWIAAFVCGSVLSVVALEARSAGKAGLLVARAAESKTVESKADSTSAESKVANGEVLGRLEIRSIGLTVPLLNDVDTASLRKGVGHIRGTAMPGGLGNAALAGHRDTFFRPLRNIRRGMTMAVFTEQGRYDYVVDRTEIVAPERVSILSIGDVPELTLITCFPFDYIGSAPNRFIVHAHLASVAPSN